MISTCCSSWKRTPVDGTAFVPCPAQGLALVTARRPTCNPVPDQATKRVAIYGPALEETRKRGRMHAPEGRPIATSPCAGRGGGWKAADR